MVSHQTWALARGGGVARVGAVPEKSTNDNDNDNENFI